MAYRFNGGLGAVTCDVCNIIIDEDLGYSEYEQCYNGAMSGNDGDICLECSKGIMHSKFTEKEVEERLEKRRKILKL